MNLARILMGKPLANEDAQHQAISNRVGLAVFASDNLSSVAYATQEILVVLAAGAALMSSTAGRQMVFANSIPIAIGIVALLVVLTISYRQTIFAYPSGGGAYIVSRDNLGDVAAQIAGASLLINYVLTAAVSIASGVEQLVSLPFLAWLGPYRVWIGIAAIVFMAWMNLRGVKESGFFFAVPTYFFIAVMLLTLAVGLVRWLTGTLGIVHDIEPVHVEHPEAIGLFLILKAFAAGCSAVTGVEAISNGIQAFKEPKSHNAAKTMLVMSALLGVMFIGTSVLALQIQAVPSHTQTIIYQVGLQALGPLVPIVIAATTLILILAANTAFADFPRVAALQARDGFLPRQLAQRGSRLVFSWGIVLLAVAAIALIVLFRGSVSQLLPLYSIGVFLGFSMSQAGMVVHWWRTRDLKPGETKPSLHGTLHADKGWWWKMLINLVGGIATFVVMQVIAVARFGDGAWITVVLIPILVLLFLRIHRHYTDVARVLSTSKSVLSPEPKKIYTVALVDDIHKGTVEMIKFCMALGTPWEAVHFNDDDEKTHKIQAKWRERMGLCQHELTIVNTPYRNISRKIEEYVLAIRDQKPDTIIHVVMGQIVMDTWAGRALHSNTSIGIKLRLEQHDDVIVTDVSYPIHSEDARSAPHNEVSDYRPPGSPKGAHGAQPAGHAAEAATETMAEESVADDAGTEPGAAPAKAA